MLTTLILGAALLGQAPQKPSTEAELAAKTAALKKDIQDRAARKAMVLRQREAMMTPEAKAARAKAWEEMRYRRAAAAQQDRENRARMAERERAAWAKEQARQQAEAERLFPLQLEQQRLWLEQQRQAFQQQAEAQRLQLEADRNRILDQGINRIYRGQYVPPQTHSMWWLH